MPKKPDITNPKCPICKATAVKNGNRSIKLRKYQRFLCKECGHSFTTQLSLQKNKTYPLSLILNTISNLNLGYSLKQTKNYYKIKKSTLSYWYSQFKTQLPYHRIRNEIRKHYKPADIIIIKRFIHHKQPFLYQYHSLKLQFTKKFPTLINYLKTINTSLPNNIFQNSERISAISKTNNNQKQTKIEITTKQNYATKLANIAKQITKDNKKRHNIIENFMLINDTATIATEIPVYLKETKLNKPITGHIDILQARYHKLYILDFKPEPINKQQTINQLILYRKALSQRTNIKTNKIKLAFFNDKGYYEIN